MYVTAEAEIYLKDVYGSLPEDDAGTAEAGHEVLGDDAHAGVRLGSEVGQNFLSRRLFTYLGS